MGVSTTSHTHGPKCINPIVLGQLKHLNVELNASKAELISVIYCSKRISSLDEKEIQPFSFPT